jgi:hypothetical protein
MDVNGVRLAVGEINPQTLVIASAPQGPKFFLGGVRPVIFPLFSCGLSIKNIETFGGNTVG